MNLLDDYFNVIFINPTPDDIFVSKFFFNYNKKLIFRNLDYTVKIVNKNYTKYCE
jgi:predicted choloylglycine hydrolase